MFVANIFSIRKTETGLKTFNHFFLAISVGLVAVASIGCLLKNGTVSPFLFLLGVAIMRFYLRNWTHPMWLIFHSWSLLYVELPCLWFALAGKTINYAEGLPINPVMLNEADLLRSLCWLALFYIAFQAAFLLKTRFLEKPNKKYYLSDQTFFKVLILYALILAAGFVRELGFAASRMDRMPGLMNEIIRFCFHDAAIFFTLVLLNMGRLNLNNTRSVLRVHAVLLLSYLGFFTYSGSKGAVLTAFFLCILAPICCAPILGFSRIILPRLTFLALLTLIAPCLFFIGHFFRIFISQKSSAFGDLNGAWQITVDGFGSVEGFMETVLCRISAEISRYLLLIADYFENGLNPLRNEFLQYIGRNAINLFLPGTPFPENYYMSSMLLPKILNHETLESSDFFLLATQLNSQPFTIFGILVFFFGISSPIAYFLFCLVTKRILEGKWKKTALGILLLYLFSFSMYGPEFVLQRSLMFLVNLFLIISLAKIIERRRKKPLPLIKGEPN